MSTEITRDPYTVRHLNAWLEQQINGDAFRERVREAMLALVDTDPEYYGSQSWWLVFDRSGCQEIEASFR
jgi:hypothetical protein